jgi:hypothetical protein
MRKLGVSTQVRVVQKLRGMALPGRERAANDRQKRQVWKRLDPARFGRRSQVFHAFPRIL